MMAGAVIIAGGQSRRYGRDKATLPLGEGTLLEHVARCAGAVTDRVVIVGGPEPPAGATRVDDLVPGEGPLQAALAGARALGEGPLLLLACDLPSLTIEVTAWLCRPLGCAARIPRIGGREQYLAAVYGSAAWARFSECWSAGCRSLHRAVAGLGVEWVDEADLLAARLDPAWLTDVDTPDAWPPGPG